MQENEDEITKNLQDFFEKFGPKEFVTIYFQQVLLEMYKVGIHSSNKIPSSDLVHQYFFTKNGDVRLPQEMDDFDDEVEERCFALASEIVESLGASFFSELPSSPQELDEDVLKSLNRNLQNALKRHLEVRWGR